MRKEDGGGAETPVACVAGQWLLASINKPGGFIEPPLSPHARYPFVGHREGLNKVYAEYKGP